MDTALSSESGVGGIEPSVVNERNSRSETPDVEQNESGGSMPRMEESEMDIEEPIPSETNEALQLRLDVHIYTCMLVILQPMCSKTHLYMYVNTQSEAI